MLRVADYERRRKLVWSGLHRLLVVKDVLYGHQEDWNLFSEDGIMTRAID